MVQIPTQHHISPWTKKIIHVFLAVIVIILLPLDILFLYNVQYLNKAFPNVFVNDLNLGGRNRREATQLLTESIKNQPSWKELKYKDKSYHLEEMDVNLHYDVKKTVQDVYDVGRDGTFISDTATRLQLLKSQKHIPLEITYSEEKADAIIASISAKLNQPSIPPSIIIETINGRKQASVSAGRRGLKLDETKTARKT